MTQDFSQLFAALAVFFASHSVPAVPGLRRGLVARLGERGYLVLHSVLASLSLVWLLVATVTAPRVELWGFQLWAKWLPVLVMPLACTLLVAGLTTANPFSLGWGRGFDPGRPGIVGLTRHPLLWATALWSGTHLAANGELRAVLLFGALCGFSLVGMALFDRRRRRSLGAQWEAWRGAMHFGSGDVPGLLIQAGGGLALYVGLLALHGFLFGVSPLDLF